MDHDDADLLRAYHDGDRAAGDVFVARHLPSLWRYARVLAENTAVAEDLVQDSFLAALRVPDQFRGPGSARGWLLVILRHAAYRQHRRRVGEPAQLETMNAEEPLVHLGVAAGWGSDPERVLIAAEDADRLASALARLAPADREVVHLRDIEGLDGATVAELLGITLAAAKSRLHRGRLALMAALREGVNDADRS